MKARLLKAYSVFPAGAIVDFDAPITMLLIQREIAVAIKEDPDRDGKAEGGVRGEKKAFSRPPVGKSGRR